MPSKLQVLRRRAFERQGGRCCYCGSLMWLVSPAELPGSAGQLASYKRLQCTAEHLVAQADGGRDSVENIAAACAHCNQTRHKRKRPPEPERYRAEVLKRVNQRRWHHPQVFAHALLGA